MPLNDRDYMRRSPVRDYKRRRWNWSFNLGISPVWVLVGINFIIFIATLVRNDLIVIMGLSPSFFMQEPWTILTAMFVHGGIFHILFNMLTLYFFGTYLYRMVGSGRFLILYLVGGIVGNLLFVLVGPENSLVVGASGAIYALGGALVVMIPNIRVALWGILPMPLWVAILVVGVVLSFLPGVAWQAHIGGLAVGLIAGYFFRRRLRRYYGIP